MRLNEQMRMIFMTFCLQHYWFFNVLFSRLKETFYSCFLSYLWLTANWWFILLWTEIKHLFFSLTELSKIWKTLNGYSQFYGSTVICISSIRICSSCYWAQLKTLVILRRLWLKCHFLRMMCIESDMTSEI